MSLVLSEYWTLIGADEARVLQGKFIYLITYIFNWKFWAIVIFPKYSF